MNKFVQSILTREKKTIEYSNKKVLRCKMK